MLRLLKKKNRGFTLIELMIVIAIIAILAAILVPNFMRARSQSQLAACTGNLKNIATAEELYSTDNNGLYASTAALLSGGAAYIRTWPSCPGNNAAYAITSNTAAPANYTVSQPTTAVHTNVTSSSSGADGVCNGSALLAPCYTATGGLDTN